MWIIPKNLQLSSGAPDTAGFISDLNEQSQACASSFMVRSKPSPARTWSQKWRRDSWTQHLSGRILKPFHAKLFETEWTCLWPVIPANRSAQQASGSESKTLATSGRTLQDQLELFTLDSVSLKMSEDTSPSDSAKSSETWEQQVTRRRGEYSARVKSARLISASGYSSWPTIRASEYKDVGPVGSKSHDHMLGKHYLCAVVTQEEHGQAAPANPSTHGNRQGLSEQDWRTPGASDGEGGVMEMREGCAGKYKLRDHVAAMQQEKGVNLHKPVQSQVLHENEKVMGPMPPSAMKLNPRWVETLMGLPVGWVMPSCVSPVTIARTNCDSSATESCQQQQNELFAH